MAANPLPSFQLVNAASMTGTVTSAVQVCEYNDNIGIQFVYTGTPTGTFSVQVSCSYDPNTKIGTFSTLTVSGLPVPAGAAGNGYVGITGLAASYYRVVYTPTSGTGTLNIYVAGKGV